MPTDTPSAMLVWETPEYGGASYALTPFGVGYAAIERTDGCWYTSFDGDEFGALHPDLLAARAACEADYARRMTDAGFMPVPRS